jgi:gamma-glutamyl phosphate reductase
MKSKIYYVAYSFINHKGETGFGADILETPLDLQTVDGVNSAISHIQKNTGYESVIILNLFSMKNKLNSNLKGE